jgi:hypothetical protein
MSSMAPIYPMGMIPFRDPRAVSTAQAMLEFNRQRSHRDGKEYNFPWSWGVLATIMARQGKGDLAWQTLQNTRPTICQFGGMTEVMEDQDWNMQYFCTAQAAVVTALHSLVLQGDGKQISIFPALPSGWQAVSFERLLANGLEVSAQVRPGGVLGEVRNITPESLRRSLVWKSRTVELSLEPGGAYDFDWKE